MIYEKKNFDGDYLKYYNIIKMHGSSSISEIYNYTPVANNIKSLYWEGDTKEEICKNLDFFDESCASLYIFVNFIIKKTKIVYGVLGPELNLLKKKIELYNECVDEYNRTYSQLQAALNDQKKDGDTNG